MLIPIIFKQNVKKKRIHIFIIHVHIFNHNQINIDMILYITNIIANVEFSKLSY